MLTLTSNTQVNPLYRIRNHFSSLVNNERLSNPDSPNPNSANPNPVTVKDWSAFLGIDHRNYHKAEQGLIHTIPVEILQELTKYLVAQHITAQHITAQHIVSNKSLVDWFNVSKESPQKYDFYRYNPHVTVNGQPNPLWQAEHRPRLSDIARPYLSALWDLHVLDSLKATEYPWFKEDLPLATEYTPKLFKEKCSQIALAVGKDNTPVTIAATIKMNPWSIEKYSNNKMQNVPKHFVERLRLWSEIQDIDVCNRKRDSKLSIIKGLFMELAEMEVE